MHIYIYIYIYIYTHGSQAGSAVFYSRHCVNQLVYLACAKWRFKISQAKYCETTDTKQYLPEHRVPKLQGVDPSLHVALDEEQ